MKTVFLRTITGCALALSFYFAYFYCPPAILSIAFILIWGLIMIFEWPSLVAPLAHLQWLITPVYPTLPFILLIILNQSPVYRPLIVLLFISVPLFDTGSYIAGKLFGKNLIMPRVSPGKTWEGFAGGLVTEFILFKVIFWHHPLPFFSLIFIICSICTLALFGDLLESWFKRRARLKDSGTLLPGHGGLLDRFDSIMTVSIFFYLAKDHLIKLL